MPPISRHVIAQHLEARTVGLASVFSTVLIAERVLMRLPTASRRVLDVGGGESPFAGSISSQMHLSVDWDLKSVSHASNQIRGDASALPVREGSADLVLCTEVVEHVVDERALYRELRRVVADDGLLVLSAPFVHGVHESPHDYRRPTSIGLAHGLSQAGFEVLTVDAVGDSRDVVRDHRIRSAARAVRALGRRLPGPVEAALLAKFRSAQVRLGRRSQRRTRKSTTDIDPYRPDPRLTLGYVVTARVATGGAGTMLSSESGGTGGRPVQEGRGAR